MFHLSDYNYNLPEGSIAQSPIQPAHNSKLLYIKIQDGETKLFDHHCYDLPDILSPDSLLIANNSQVFAARIPLSDTKIILSSGIETRLESGEIFIVKVLFDENNQIHQQCCIIRGSDKKHFKPGSTIYFDDHIYGKSIEFVEDGIVLELNGITLEQLCNLYGDYPLPPYITNTSKDNQSRYQTSFGKTQGSVATPTAGLHFTRELRENLHKKGIHREEITLHVGIGTFAPVVSEDIRQHELHSELITISWSLFETIYHQKISKKPLITIGTTTTRTIESLPYLYTLLDKENKKNKLSDPCRERRDNISNSCQNPNFLLIISMNSDTITLSSALYIYPGFQRILINGIITNFHLPQTSLVVLVSGLLGYQGRKESYEYALTHHYRFASFGDAMFIDFTTL